MRNRFILSNQRHHQTRISLSILRIVLLFFWAVWLFLQIGLQIRHGREQGADLSRVATSSLDLPFVGTNVSLDTFSDTERHDALVRLREHGVGWVRQRFDWGQIEPSPGRFEWQASDDIITAIHESGLTPVVVLDGSPEWARSIVDRTPTDNPSAPPQDFLEFARFAATFADRYGDRVRYYQIWHEPNIAPHWGSRHIEPVHYAQLLRQASAAIRTTDEDAMILTAALAPTADRGHTAIDEVTYLRRLYAAGVQPSIDAVAIEPFGFGHSANDTRQRREVLNFQRAAWIRRAMVAAGDGETPLIATSYGWNRQPASPWRTVTPAHQRQFLRDALDIGWEEWPWVAGMGWAVDRPAAADDPVWGFALDEELLSVIKGWTISAPVVRSGSLPVFHWTLVAMIGGLVMVLWRGWAAIRLLPWRTWRSCYLQWPVWLRLSVWLLLIVFYYFATWPPLIILWLAMAALLIALQPHIGLWLAALLLPFTFQHKELDLVNMTLLITPVQAVVLASLPAMVLQIVSKRRTFRLQPLVTPGRNLHTVLISRRRVGFQSWYSRLTVLDWFVFAWLLLSLIAAFNVWHWPGYADGLVDLVFTPLLLYGMLRIFADEENHRTGTALALFMGGLLVALFGIVDWLLGGGTPVDAVRRLVGPYFSPNHAALYLGRTFFLGLGIWLALRDRTLASLKPIRAWMPWLLASALCVVLLAVVLTASRGALLGLAAGSILFVWLSASGRARDNQRIGWVLLLLLIGGLVAGLAFWPRMSNTTTVLERLDIWRTTVLMWPEAPFVGVGPGGYYWHFPAFIPTGASIDPNLRHPHNVWLETISLWGIAGLIWLLSLLIWSMRHCWAERHGLRQHIDGGIVIGLLAGLCAGLAHGQVDAFGVLADIAGWNWLALGLWRTVIDSSNPESAQ